MRLTELMNESANTDLNFFNTIANIIIEWMPNTIPSNDYITISALDKDHPLVEKYKNQIDSRYHDTLVHLLTKTKFLFFNLDEDINTRDFGSHIYDERTHMSAITVMISAMRNSSDSISKNELLDMRIDGAIKTFKGILIHEMRHAHQKVLYGTIKSHGKYDYHSTPDEIDAAWIHHLQDYDVNNYDNATEYTKDVLKSFYEYKTLNDKQKKHYLKKTAAYWYNHHNEKYQDGSIQDRHNARMDSKRDEQLDIIINAINTSNDKLKDLRNYDGYTDENNFIFPVDAMRTAVHSALTKENSYDIQMISYLYGFLSLVYYEQEFDTSFISKFFKKKYNVSPDDAIEQLSNEGFGRFNTQFFTNQIINVFK